MQRQLWSFAVGGRRTVTLCVVALLLAGAAVGTVAADPRLFVSGGSVESNTAIVGDDVDITVRVSNTGSDGGAIDVPIKRNGGTLSTPRVQVDADSEKRVTETVTFEEPGNYTITAGKNDRRIGTIRVSRTAASVANEQADSRTISVRGGSVPTGEPYAVDLPAATNRSFALERWTAQTAASSYEQQIVEYSTPSAAPVTLPAGDAATVASVVTVDSTAEIERATMRFSLNRSRLRALDLERSQVTMYHRNGSRWEPLETSVVETRTDRVVYEATATSFSTYAVGSIESDISVQSTAIQASASENGQRLSLNAVLNNTGEVDGEYDLALSVNGEEVNTTTATVPAGETRTVMLSHEVGAAGTYEMALNGNSAGSLDISDEEIDSVPEENNGESDDGGLLADDGPVLGPLPATILGFDTLYLGGGIGVGLAVFLGILLLLRRGGDSGGGNSSGFDQL